MKILFSSVFLILFNIYSIQAQVGINTTTPDESAALHIESSDQGILIPRMTTAEKQAIVNPAINLMVFDTDDGNYEYNSGTPEDPEWTRTLDEAYSGARGAMNITSTDYNNGPQTSFTTKGVATRQKISGTTTASDLANFTASGNNRLVYTGTQTRFFRSTATISFFANANNTILAFYIAKGNSGDATATILQDTKSYVISSGTGDIVTVPVNGSVELSEGDFIEVWVERNADSGGGSSAYISVATMNLLIN